MRIALIGLLACVFTLRLMADGTEANQSNAPGPKDVSQAEAEMLVKRGKQEMLESNDDASRSVAAAVDFSRALKYYEQSNNIDKVCDLEANIFWCKKRMNEEQITKFLAAKGNNSQVKEALAKAEEVVSKEVPKEEAQNYLDRADKFAKDHPDDAAQIAAHYFEVAERFVGTDVGIRAQKLSLSAQEQQMKALEDEKKRERETLFSRKSTGEAGHAAVPSPEDLRAANLQLHKLYRADFAKSKPNQKRRLIAKLLAQVPTTHDDATTQYALLCDIIDLSTNVSDWYSIIRACDSMSQNFAGVDALAKKKEIFSHVHGNPVVQGILKLLDNDADADSNAVVGKYFCFDAGRMDLGLPMLMHGNDPEYKAAAEMEILKPSNVQQVIELADKWYGLGKKSRSPAREAMLTRSFSLYKQAEAEAQGVSKDRVKARIDEIDGLLPMTNLDYDNLTPKQWDRLKGEVVEISAAKDRNDTGFALAHGERLRVVPNPADTWSTDYWGSLRQVNAKGEQAGGGGHHSWDSEYEQFRPGTLVVQVEAGPFIKPGIIEGEGRIFCGPWADGWGAGGTGVIRVKIMRVSEDE